MKKILCIVFLVSQIWSVNAQNSKTDTISKKNYLYLSMGAPAMFYGLSYEHLVYQFNDTYMMSFEKFKNKFPEFKVTPYEVGIREMIKSYKEN